MPVNKLSKNLVLFVLSKIQSHVPCYVDNGFCLAMRSSENRKALVRVLKSNRNVFKGPNRDLANQQVGVSIHFVDICKISLQ